MRFTYDKAACQNTRRALQKEWLLTNGLGDYASSSILNCNTRKYHGLLVASSPNGREVLLSAMEESIVGGGREFFISTRQHPGQFFPQGHQYLEKFEFDAWPQFTYRVGDLRIKREIILFGGITRLLIRWSISSTATGTAQKMPQLTLRIKPLLAYRGFHALTHANPAINPRTSAVPSGFGVTPYAGMPPLYFQSSNAYDFTPRPDWYRDIIYFQEKDRGFDFSEDLFQPGVIDIPLPPLPEGGSVYMAVGTEELPKASEELPALWQETTSLRTELRKKTPGFIGHLARRGQDFCVVDTNGVPQVIAGYHWFDAWGRDTLIALPGLAFYAGRTRFGLDVLEAAGGCMRNGLIPNMFGTSGQHAYNSADASLWYAFAVQCYLSENPDGIDWVREQAWPVLKAIVTGYRKGPGMGIYVDDAGLLHAGDFQTQLTWMDANSGGKPVTPRNGCPVELTALWYNTQAFVNELSKKFNEPEWGCHDQLMALRRAFFEHFWVAREGGYLGDVWRDGILDQSIRPNQILAVSLPHRALAEQYRPSVMECVRDKLLTSYGLRTLAPEDRQYRPRYEGSPEERDSAYHQGTVWPWLLGQYTDGIMRVAWDIDGAARAILDKTMPLFADHLSDAGIGSISEVFDGNPPARPNGTIAQAWSVAECLRMLITLKRQAPAVYADWERALAKRLANPISGDKAGVCRVEMILDDENPANPSAR